MRSSAPGNDSQPPRWISASATVIALPLGVFLLALTPALSVIVAWQRMRLRRAIRRQWRDRIRYVVWDDGGAWRATIREEWLPRHASATIVVPRQGRAIDWSADERLACRVLNEWGRLIKGSERALAVVVSPDAEPIAIRLPRAHVDGASGERDLLRQRLSTMATLNANAR